MDVTQRRKNYEPDGFVGGKASFQEESPHGRGRKLIPRVLKAD